MPTQARADPARNTNCAERSPPSASPSLLPSFEALIVQYYNLKANIIYFVLKRKMQLSFPLSLFSKAVHSFRRPTAVSTQAEVNGEVSEGLHPGQSRDPTPLRKILLFSSGALWKELYPFRGRLGPSHPGPAAHLSAVCSVPGPGIFIVAKGNEVGVGEEGPGQGTERWGWGGPGHILWQGPVTMCKYLYRRLLSAFSVHWVCIDLDFCSWETL